MFTQRSWLQGRRPSCRARLTSVSLLQLENGPSTSSLNVDMQEKLVKVDARPSPTLAGACEFPDIRTLLKEWVTTIPGTAPGGGPSLLEPDTQLSGSSTAAN